MQGESMSVLRKLSHCLPDELYIQLQYFHHFHKFANLEYPQTFNEKLNWLKLHDRNPLYTTLVDKYAVKQWVADKIGAQYIIPTFIIKGLMGYVAGVSLRKFEITVLKKIIIGVIAGGALAVCIDSIRKY